MRRRKCYRVDQEPNFFINTNYNPLLGGPKIEEEKRNLTNFPYSPPHPEGATKVGDAKNQDTLGIPHISTSLTPHPPPYNSPTVPPPPPNPLRRGMVDDIRMPTFKGLISKGVDQFSFATDVVWKVK